MVSSECVSRYCDLFTTETKELNFFPSHHTLFLMLVWWHESWYKINYSHFFWGGWCGVLKWGNVRRHKRVISASTIDFRPTLMYESTSADLWQQRLTSFCAVCGVLFYYKRESTTGHSSSGAVWESRWTSWAVRPNGPSGFRGHKDLHARTLVSACP